MRVTVTTFPKDKRDGMSGRNHMFLGQECWQGRCGTITCSKQEGGSQDCRKLQQATRRIRKTTEKKSRGTLDLPKNHQVAERRCCRRGLRSNAAQLIRGRGPEERGNPTGTVFTSDSVHDRIADVTGATQQRVPTMQRIQGTLEFPQVKFFEQRG